MLIIERATSLIDELGSELDRQLASEPQATERLRLLRGTTSRITRAANDAIAAYGKAGRALDAEIQRTGESGAATVTMQARLHAARLDLLRALRLASRRYPWGPSLASQPTAPPTRRP